ncbi:MAG: hypothetical protein AAGI91_02775 [Bacteroidota bacterium]
MPLARRLFDRPAPVRQRAARHAVLRGFGLLALLFVLAGCDFNDDRDPRGSGVIVENEVRVSTFTLNDEDDRGNFLFSRTLSGSGLEVQYEGRPSILTPAAVDDGVVLLYASDQTGAGGIDGLIRNGWTALPITLGVDADGEDFFVDYTLTTTYTYDVERLYVNLIASNDLGAEDFAITDATLASIENIAFRLVTIPGGGFNRGIDYSDYNTVRQAYGLPD